MPEEEEWTSYFRPRDTLLALGLRQDMVFADLGCGYGTFTIPAAEIVGHRGRVYAIDIDRRLVDIVMRKAAERALTNVEAMVGDITLTRSITLPDESVDFALLANVIHGTMHRVALLKKASRILRSRGVLAIVNWIVGETPRGPPLPMRPTAEQTLQYIRRARLINPLTFDLAPFHYAVVAHKVAFLSQRR